MVMLTEDEIKILEAVVFALETVAHLQHREALLLPVCEEAREILAKVRKSNL